MPNATLAQEVTRGETVTGRSRPELDPLGVRLGGFLLYPEVGVQETYDDNIFATDTDKEADFITSIEPSLNLRSNWNNHALNLHADSRVVRYLDNNDESFEDYTLGTDGRLDVQRDIALFGGAGYRVRHEDRSSPDDVGGEEPTEYDVLAANVGGSIRFNRLSLRMNNQYEQYSFDNVQNGLGTTINNEDRDREETKVSLQAGYEIGVLREVFVRGTYNWRNYDSATDDAGVNRDSEGYEVVVGGSYDLTGITFVELFIGYRSQEYDDPTLQSVDGIGGGANLIWNVTGLTSVTGGISREVGETTLGGSSGYLATRFNLQVDHELLRNLLLNARASYGQDDFEGIERQDDYYEFGFGARYQLNRNFSLSGGYTYRQRESDVPGADFDQNLVMVRLGARL